MYGKYPEPGRVKTRLAAHIGEKEAAYLYGLFVKDIFDICSRGSWELSLHFAPPTDENLIRNWLPGQYFFHEQQGINLGDRMSESLSHEIKNGASRVLLIGTDIPQLSECLLRKAFDDLEKYDSVIGPSEDGGYYLIGFNSKMYTPDIFKGIPWSSPHTFEAQLERLHLKKLSCALQPVLVDIDTVEDLRLFYRGSHSPQKSDSHTLNWITVHPEIYS